ncbi:PucR family transcriptional regulator [Sphaerisporangium album]|uniref:PucR family transcriptional regulator n=1 Tax=Sphaerisporangium album TaxID=509200 RepID=A0A367FB43_9ACTN|nr:PucR family transcriptional regulator [Sphaerisporangium album]RCG26780.1 PucR family transcriptional regulator [Sphaerisporangium album]
MVADDVQETLESLAAAVGRGVSVDDLDGRVIAHSAHGADADPVRARAILSRSVPAEVGEWQRAHGVGAATGPVRVPANPALSMGARLCVSLLHRGRRLGYLWITEGERPLTPAETDRAVRDAATVAALLDEQDFPGPSSRSRRVLRRLLTGDRETRYEAAAEMLARGLADHDRPYRVLAARPDVVTDPGQAGTLGVTPAGVGSGFSGAGDGVVTSAADLERLIGGGLRGPRVPAAYARIDGLTVVLVPEGPVAGAPPPDRAGRGSTWPGVVPGTFPLGGAVGVSARHAGLETARAAYREALAASRAVAADPAIGPVAVWPEVGVYRFFGPSAEEPSGARPEPLALLEGRDPRGVLARTLEVYLDSGGDAQATAEATHLHRTSLYYRLRRIEEITGRDLRDGRDRLELHLALKLARWNASR